MKSFRLFLSGLLLVLCCLGWAQGNVNVGRYDTVHVVPAPAKVTIDGDLADWDTSGEFYTYRYEEQKDRYFYRGYMMYDAQYLYLAAHIGDGTPMMNNNSPETDSTTAWRGDCLQVRISSDPKLGWPLNLLPTNQRTNENVVHITLWYYTERKQPCLQLFYGMDYHGNKINPPGYSGAFKKDADGRGYVFEYAVPWTLLNAGDNPPKAGDVTACTWQMLWGDETGRKYVADLSEVRNPDNAGFVYQDAGAWGKMYFEKTGHLPPGTVKAREAKAKPQTGFFPINYRIPGQGKARVSMQVKDVAGHTVRWLLGDAERPAGPNTELWNGLNDDGNPVAPGKYTVEWCYHHGVGAKLLASADNPGNPPWNTSDNTGSWAGDYEWPAAVCATDKYLYIAHQAGEASRTIIKITPDGRRIWGVDPTQDLTIPILGMATDGKDLYLLHGSEFYGGRHWNNTWKAGVARQSGENGYLLPIGNTNSSSLILNDPERTGIGTTKELTAIAVDDKCIYVSSEQAGAIYCIDKTTGKQVRVIGNLDRPRGIASGPGGRLYVVTANQILRMNPDSGAREALVPVEFLRDNCIVDPWTIAIARNGDFFVGMRGAEQRVLHFAADGRFLNGIGKRGGMLVPGPWDAGAMRNPQGMCAGPDGNLWVTEGIGNPKRTSVWTPDGKLVRDFIGPAPYSSDSVVDPADPQYVYVDGTKFKMDFTTGYSTPAAVVGGNYGTYVSGGRFIHFRQRTFLAAGALYEMRGGRFVTLVSVGRKDTAPVTNWGSLFPVIQTDRNLDGIIQPAEEQLLPNWGGLWPPRLMFIADNLDLYLAGQTYQYLFRVPFEGFDANGVPIYNAEHIRVIFTGQKETVAKYPGAQLYPYGTPYGPVIESLDVDAAGNLYLMINAGAEVIKRGQPILDKGHRMAKFTPDGKLLWEYRNVVVSHPASRNTTISKPGEIHGAIKFTGEFGRYLTLGSYYGQYHIIDKETGLYIGAFTPDTRSDPPLNEFTVLTENFNGAACYSAKLKKYLYAGGDAQARVWEVLGLDGVQFGRFAVEFTAADHAKAIAAGSIELGVPASEKLCKAAALGVKVDGDLAEWADAEWASFGVDDARKARAAASWAGNRINVAFDVADDSPLLNRGGNPNLLFKSGDAVEFCISSADPDIARKDDKPVTGDQRILITLVKDEQGKEQPIAMIYEPKSARAEKKPGTFSSPTGREEYDYVAPLTSAQIAVKRRDGGYTLEVSFDCKELGLAALEQGQRLRADFGVLFSDKGGAITLTRAMWSDNSDEVGVNNDIPTESRLHPGRWGWMVVK